MGFPRMLAKANRTALISTILRIQDELETLDNDLATSEPHLLAIPENLYTAARSDVADALRKVTNSANNLRDAEMEDK